VAGVGSALITYHDVVLSRQQVDDLAFGLHRPTANRSHRLLTMQDLPPSENASGTQTVKNGARRIVPPPEDGPTRFAAHGLRPTPARRASEDSNRCLALPLWAAVKLRHSQPQATDLSRGGSIPHSLSTGAVYAGRVGAGQAEGRLTPGTVLPAQPPSPDDSRGPGRAPGGCASLHAQPARPPSTPRSGSGARTSDRRPTAATAGLTHPTQP